MFLGGFHDRLDASRKYIFGVSAPWGVDNDNYKVGAYVLRGQEADPAVNVAPEHDTYKWTKLDPKNPEDKAFVEDIWCCDKEIDVGDGKKVPLTDQYAPRVFK